MTDLNTVPKKNDESARGKGDNEDEDDYMNMIIVEPTTSNLKETYTQRRLRKEREARERGRAKSKQELAIEEKLAREKALAKSLLANAAMHTTEEPTVHNKGLAMMAKMGFKPGAALGRRDNSDARLEPIMIQVKEDRGGIGMDTERKRRYHEEIERQEKKIKVEESEYRERVRKERESTRIEMLIAKAMRIAETMHDKRKEEEGEGKEVTEDDKDLSNSSIPISHQPVSNSRKHGLSKERSFKQTNVLWRGLVRMREEKEKERQMRLNLRLHQSLSHQRLPTYNDGEEDSDDKWAITERDDDFLQVLEEEEEDVELDEFNALDPLERLQKLLSYLRTEHRYCFWCKYSYPDPEMSGCPGINEEDHD
ncbi:putative g-patch domain protein [Golovinomyces cichoracearum]|uniref:Putative g-patch domain protein n=1 Tax=Golovinomyces cichoracearum TaxID=62708 RepID=A0A420IE86_9PEZI|nr:putative g-patch domain protein [Golovinomyces cichoracearum]